MLVAAPVCTVWIEDRSPARLSLSIISTPPEHRRKGHATAALAALTAFADTHGLALSLTPDGGFQGHTGMSTAQLTSLYRAHGFRPHRDQSVMDTMLRLPRTP